MKLLITANCFLPGMGGTEVYSHDLALGLSRQKDCTVFVLAPYSKESKPWDARQPFRITRYRSRFERVFFFFKNLFSRKIEKIFVTHRAHFLTLAVIARKLLRIPFWVTLHGTEYFGPDKAKGIVKKLLCAERVFVTSRFVKKQALEQGIPETKLSLIPPALDAQRFHPDVDSIHLREKHGLNGKKVLVTLSRLVPEKAIGHVIEALAEIRDEFPDFHYFILGEGEDEAKLKEQVRGHKLEDRITFTGMVPHHQLTSPEGAYLNLADVFILTSLEEPFGICYLEAGACGKPVIACDSGGAPDIVEHERTGLLTQPGNIEAIKSAVLRLLTDPDLAARMGANARIKVESSFSQTVIYGRIRNLLLLNEI